jgi:hypothetical protein
MTWLVRRRRQRGWLIALFASIPCVAHAEYTLDPAGREARAAIQMQVRIPKMLRLQQRERPATVTVTEDDVARGYVDVDGGVLEISYNGRGEYDLQAQAVSAWATVVTIRADGARGARRAMVPVSYRVHLAPQAGPGSYGWPILLSLQEP